MKSPSSKLLEKWSTDGEMPDFCEESGNSGATDAYWNALRPSSLITWCASTQLWTKTKPRQNEKTRQSGSSRLARARSGKSKPVRFSSFWPAPTVCTIWTEILRFRSAFSVGWKHRVPLVRSCLSVVSASGRRHGACRDPQPATGMDLDWMHAASPAVDRHPSYPTHTNRFIRHSFKRQTSVPYSYHRLHGGALNFDLELTQFKRKFIRNDIYVNVNNWPHMSNTCLIRVTQ